MNFLNDLKNHIDQLESALESSLASLPARVLATIKVDPSVSVILLAIGVVAGALVVLL